MCDDNTVLHAMLEISTSYVLHVHHQNTCKLLIINGTIHVNTIIVYQGMGTMAITVYIIMQKF